MEKWDCWDTTAAWELPGLLGISGTAQQDTWEGESGIIWDVNHELTAPTSLSKHTFEAGGRLGRTTPPSFPLCPVRALIYPFIYFSLAEALPLIMVWMGPAPFKVLNSLGGLQALDRGGAGSNSRPSHPCCTRGLAGTLGTRFNPSINVTSRQSSFPPEPARPNSLGCGVPSTDPELLPEKNEFFQRMLEPKALLGAFTSALSFPPGYLE